MTQFNKEEYNKMCAEFLKWEVEMPEDLNQFDSDWNWIMEVIDKIEITSMDFHGRFRVFISSDNCCINATNLDTSRETRCYAYFNDCYGASKKEAVVQAIWEFLNWYKKQRKITLKLVSIFRDGGTKVFVDVNHPEVKTIPEAEALPKYYLDNRIGSTTKGELFDRYPKEPKAVILDKSNFIFP